jgi:2-hydroxy-3-keto-5-methylthiopentenyl-1-phosphate phosphatase
MNLFFKQDTIALVYDFDGTLSPQPMQEYTVLPELGEDPAQFWDECTDEARKHNADPMLTYMRLLQEKMESQDTHLDRDELRRLASGIEYFPGVLSWFDRVNQHVAEKSCGEVRLEHYIISAGLKEILAGVEIRKHFKKMFASEYYFDEEGVAKFPTVVVNDTSKIQFLFRINKGILDINESINDYMPEDERPVPFQNMIYIGDGLSDVPSMTVTKNNGGYAVAVYESERQSAFETCKKLMNAGRIDYFAPANYQEGEPLEHRVKLLLDVIVANVLLEKEKFSFQQVC